MVLIGLFMIIEMVLHLIMSFLTYLLSSVLDADSFKPSIGPKPFMPVSVFKRSDAEKLMNLTQ